MKKILWFGLMAILFSFKHPFYLSVTDLKYNAKESTLEGSVKLFTNDLETALKKIHHKTIDLINPTDTALTQQLLEAYLEKRLSIKINDEEKKIDLLGFEREQEAIWIYVAFKKCQLPKKVSIKNSLLFDYIKEQSNIIHLEVNGEKKSIKLNNPETLARFDF
jgi:hypothetical protein